MTSAAARAGTAPIDRPAWLEHHRGAAKPWYCAPCKRCFRARPGAAHAGSPGHRASVDRLVREVERAALRGAGLTRIHTGGYLAGTMYALSETARTIAYLGMRATPHAFAHQVPADCGPIEAESLIARATAALLKQLAAANAASVAALDARLARALRGLCLPECERTPEETAILRETTAWLSETALLGEAK